MHTSADWLTSADLPPGMRRSGEPIGLKLFHPQIRSSVGDTDILFVDKSLFHGRILMIKLRGEGWAYDLNSRLTS